MRRVLIVLLPLLAVGCAGQSANTDPAAWCHANATGSGLHNCLAAANDDHAECAALSIDRYSRCRRLMRRMREVTGTPPGPMIRGDCRMPDGSVIGMHIETCKAQGGTVLD